MILHRITKHVKDQNWFAVGLDFIIVVVGILIAFQITNWNEARIARAKHDTYLVRLHNDFEGIRARLERHLDHYADAIEGGDYMLSLIRAEQSELNELQVDQEVLRRGTETLTSARISPESAATYVEMVSEGQLSDVRPAALRDKLAEYDRLLGIVQEVSRITVDASMRQRNFIYRHIELNSVLDPSYLSGMRLELRSFDLEGMRSDKYFSIAVITLREDAMNSLGQRRFQMGLIDEIIEMIEAEIEP